MSILQTRGLQVGNAFSEAELFLNKLGLKQILILHNRQSSSDIDLRNCQFDGLKLPWLSVH